MSEDLRADDEWHQAHVDAGYDYCRSCKEYHRPPECAINEQGVPLDPWGEPWDAPVAE